MNKKLFILVLAVALLATGCNDNTAGVDKVSSGKVMAVVNGENITESQLDDYIELYKKGILETMVQDKLLEQAAKEKGVEITEEEVDTEVKTYIDSMESEEEFNKFIGERGITLDGFKLNVRQMKLRNKLIDKIKEEIEVNEDEIKKAYDSNKENFVVGTFNEIVVKNEEDSKEVKGKLQEGTKAESLAEQMGDKILNVSTINDIGVTFGELGEALKGMKVGDVHIIRISEEQVAVYQLVERKEDFNELKEIIKENFKEEQKYIKYEEFIQDKSKNAKIEYKNK